MLTARFTTVVRGGLTQTSPLLGLTLASRRCIRAKLTAACSRRGWSSATTPTAMRRHAGARPEGETPFSWRASPTFQSWGFQMRKSFGALDASSICRLRCSELLPSHPSVRAGESRGKLSAGLRAPTAALATCVPARLDTPLAARTRGGSRAPGRCQGGDLRLHVAKPPGRGRKSRNARSL